MSDMTWLHNCREQKKKNKNNKQKKKNNGGGEFSNLGIKTWRDPCRSHKVAQETEHKGTWPTLTCNQISTQPPGGEPLTLQTTDATKQTPQHNL